MQRSEKKNISPSIFNFFSVLMPPSSGIAKSVDSFSDKVRILRRDFFCIEACNDAEEGQIALDVFAPFVLTQAEAEYLIKLGLRFG